MRFDLSTSHWIMRNIICNVCLILHRFIMTHVNYQVQNKYYMLDLITEANFLFIYV